MKQKILYPSDYELSHIMSEFCSSSFVNAFAQSKGIILVRSTKDQKASDLSRFYFDKLDLDKLKDEAYRQSSKHTLSGFVLKIHDSSFSPVTAIQTIREFYGSNSDIYFDPIKQEKDEMQEILYTGRVNYKNYKPGRLQFLQGDESSFEYTLQKISTDDYQIFIDGSRSTDSKKFEEILKKQIGKEGEIDLINIDRFTTSQAIRFFDELAVRFGSTDWNFQEVKHLIIKRFKTDEEEKEVKNEDLSGITQAILEGHNLRENQFVKQSEVDGYIFTAMTYEFNHKSSPYVMQIRAEFKSRPKVFEVSIINYKQREGTALDLVDTLIDKKDEYKINTTFWKVAKKIYVELTYGSRTLVGESKVEI